jgi:hypothetical protein
MKQMISKKTAGHKTDKGYNDGAIQCAEDLGAACRMAAWSVEKIDFMTGGTRAELMAIEKLRKRAAKMAKELEEIAECMIIRMKNLK